MVKHVVCFKLADSSEQAKIEAKEILLSMVGNVKAIVDIEVGTDFLQSGRSYDIVLITTFNTRADLSAYQEDTYHSDVVKKYIHAHIIASVSVDYEY